MQYTSKRARHQEDWPRHNVCHLCDIKTEFCRFTRKSAQMERVVTSDRPTVAPTGLCCWAGLREREFLRWICIGKGPTFPRPTFQINALYSLS